MALGSPGVEVTVIDESFYTPSQPNTVPFIFVTTQQDKTNPSGGTAQGTTAANNGKVWLITSQRDLTDTFGTPYFEKDSTNQAVHGSELNEYGLQAAYSVLGLTSRAYIARADVDLGSIAPATTAPTGDPVSGTYWVDTDASKYGVFEYSTTTNNGRGGFTAITPLVIDSDNVATAANGSLVPLTSFGSKGNYAIVVTPDNENTLYYKDSSNAWVVVQDNFDSGKDVQVSPHTSVPTWTTSTTKTGSVWVKTSSAGAGASWVVKYYNGSTGVWSTMTAPIYSSTRQALEKLDYAGGGKNITVGNVFIESSFEHAANAQATFKLWRRANSGATSFSVTDSTTTSTGGTFTVRESLASSTAFGSVTTVTIPSGLVAAQVPAAISSAGLTNVSATYNTTTGVLTVSHALGGDMLINDVSGLLANIGVSSSVDNVYTAASGDTPFDFLVSNWAPLVYEAAANPSSTDPAEGTLWFDSNLSTVDLLEHNGSTWVTFSGDVTVAATAPSSPADGDVWVSTADAERYGHDVYVWDSFANDWVLQDVTDQSSPDGWVFDNARVDANSSLDADAPDPDLYPAGIKLWNLRASGNTVKQWANSKWSCVTPNNEDGSGVFGRLAQRKYVVTALKAFMDSNTTIRDTDTVNFNLIACPGYPEVIANMVNLNGDRGQTAFVVGDTPMRLNPTASALTAWGNNSTLATDNGDDGLVTFDPYLGVFYPSGLATDNSGVNIVVPPSHMMLRTIISSDAKSYQWFAPAGTRRGNVDNATAVGYVTSEGEFKSVALYEGLRDVLRDVKVNPIATLPGVGIVNYGQYTRSRDDSALDRINVARLVAFLRRQLAVLAKPFLFEPNDEQTRREIKGAAESLLIELVGQRALYDFIVVCDSTNNTRERIDRSELHMDIAIEPVKAVEFIYIPLRIKNTGEIAAGV
jgi:hypothetical protein